MKNSGFLKTVIFISLSVFIIILIISTSVSGEKKVEQLVNKSVVTKISNYPSPQRGCLAKGCHQGIAPIREHDSKMAKDIYAEGVIRGDQNGCIVCHKGDPIEEKDKNNAHKDLIRFPGSMWVVDKTCGQCHEKYVYSLNRNLMQTEAGKIQGALWGWKAQTGYKKVYGNYDIKDTDGPIPFFGSEVYKSYMHKLMEKYPNNFPTELKKLPQANTKTLKERPEQAVFTYLRGECQRCHVGVKGAQQRGDYRGMGCAACHIPYSDEGLYEGNDKSTPTDVPGHILVHSIQSSRKAKVTVNDVTYSGIPSQACATCHNRGKRIGVSFHGLIEAPYNTPLNTDGSGQKKLHGKRYAYIDADHHHTPESREENPKGGLLCQDCHTTIAVHGNGNIGGATLGEVEVECSDCHGIPEKYPWELPIGFGDEFGIENDENPRGTTKDLLDIQAKFGTVYPVKDGYLLSARGNPLGNVIRSGNEVILHSAGGLDFIVPTLKSLKEAKKWKNPIEATTAMVTVGEHIEEMECYACHATWAPQCYGCHVKVDYSKGYTSKDWIATGNSHFENGETVETKKGESFVMQKGKSSEGRTYIRWEDPILGINGEGRVSPIITGCQQITTVIDTDGTTLVSNKIWRTPAGMENGGSEGQRGIDMTPAQPHTINAKARSCPSCHANPKTLGYGINGGKYMSGYYQDRYADITTTGGELISRNSTPQFQAIQELVMDLSKVVTRDGKQLQTVGHHWPLSSPLSQQQREKMERVGVCMACHQDIPNGTIPISMITKAGSILGLVPHSDEEHMKLLNKDIKWAALTRILAPGIALIIVIWIIYRRRRLKILKAGS